MTPFVKPFPKPFPFVCVSVGSCGTRSDRVFRDAWWAYYEDGCLSVCRNDEAEVARFSAGSGWLVYACDEHGSPLAPPAPAEPMVVAGRPVVAADSRPGASVTIEVVKGAGVCRRCEGCGRIANDVDSTPWSYWESLKPGEDLAVRTGVVQPVTCPACDGKGTA